MLTTLSWIIFIATSFWLMLFTLSSIALIKNIGLKNLKNDLFTTQGFYYVWLWVILWIASSWYLFGIF